MCEDKVKRYIPKTSFCWMPQLDSTDSSIVDRAAFIVDACAWNYILLERKVNKKTRQTGVLFNNPPSDLSSGIPHWC